MLSKEELLYAPMLKLKRARHHINDLNRRVESFLARKPFVLMERHERKASRATYRVKIKEAVPPEFSLIVGDAFHNLRASLDLTLFGLAGHLAPDIHFPIPKKPTAEALKAAIKKAHVQVAGKKVVEAIDRLEPHKDGVGVGLYLIHTFDIQDKHRLLILAGQSAAVITGSDSDALLRGLIPANTPTGVVFTFDAPENTKLLTVHQRYVTRHLPDSENEAKVQPTFAVTFGEGEILRGIPLVELLTRAAKETEWVIAEIVDAFLHPDNKI